MEQVANNTIYASLCMVTYEWTTGRHTSGRGGCFPSIECAVTNSALSETRSAAIGAMNVG